MTLDESYNILELIEIKDNKMKFSILKLVKKAIRIGQEHYVKLIISSLLLSVSVYSLAFLINLAISLTMMTNISAEGSTNAIIWMMLGSASATWLLTPLYMGMGKLALETCKEQPEAIDKAIKTMCDKKQIFQALGMYALISAVIMPGPMVIITYAVNGLAGKDAHYGALMAGVIITLLGLYLASNYLLSLFCLLEEQDGAISAMKKSKLLTRKIGYAKVVGTCAGSMTVKMIIGTIPVLGWAMGMALEPFIILLPGLIYLAAQNRQTEASERVAIAG